jgi:peptidoglycan hydrolase-like protein with peptidoglycan-binding domain
MADEPVLSKGSVGEWVQYLAAKLHQHGWWYGGQPWSFDAELERAVQGFQTTSGLPATGVVDAATWHALAGDELAARDGQAAAGSTTNGQHGQAPQQGQPQQGQPQQGQHDQHGGSLSADHPMQPSGSTGQEYGPPTLQFTFGPDKPVAEAEWDTGSAKVHVVLSFTGTVTATFPNAPDGVTYDVTGGGWSAAASAAMGQLTGGLYVSGLDSQQPTIGCSYGSTFAQTSIEFAPPTLTIGGQAQIATTVQTDHGPVQLTGSPGYTVAVTVTPHDNPHPDPGYDVDWQQVAATAAILASAVALVALYLFAPEVSIPATGAAAISM